METAQPTRSATTSLKEKASAWLDAVPFITRCTLGFCVAMFLWSLLWNGYKTYSVCLSPRFVVTRFEVYRLVTSPWFHGSLLHLLLNMLSLQTIGTILEQRLGSFRQLYFTLLVSVLGGLLHVATAYLWAMIDPSSRFTNDCAIGFSGVLFSMLVIWCQESAQEQMLFGMVKVPAKLYPWVLLIGLQLLMPNVSFLGHLTGILSGYLYLLCTNYLMPSTTCFERADAAFPGIAKLSGWIATAGGAYSTNGNWNVFRTLFKPFQSSPQIFSGGAHVLGYANQSTPPAGANLNSQVHGSAESAAHSQLSTDIRIHVKPKHKEELSQADEIS